jgi:hypothetical protein
MWNCDDIMWIAEYEMYEADTNGDGTINGLDEYQV